MKLFCGSNISEKTLNTLYQFEEGKRAHTTKFNHYPLEKHNNINSLNNNNKITDFTEDNNEKIKLNKNLDKNIILSNSNKQPKESNKFSNNTSELEIIEYPFDKSKQINDIYGIKPQYNITNVKNSANCNIIEYLKNRPGFSNLNYLIENDKSSNQSSSQDKYNVKDDSSKSDEIICSYIEIDNTNPNINKKPKEKNVIKNTSKIFPQIHKPIHNNYSYFISKNTNNSCSNKKLKKKLVVNSNLKKSIRKGNTIFQSYNNRKTKPEIKLENSSLIIQNNTSKNCHLHQKGSGINKTLESFRSIKSFGNSSRTNKNIKSLIKEKTSKILNTERIKHHFINIKKNKTINSINNTHSNNKGKDNHNKERKTKNSIDNNNNHIFKANKTISNNINDKDGKIKKINNNKNIIIQKRNTLYNSISINQNIKNNKKKKLISKNASKNTKNNFDSKGKLRNLLLKDHHNINKCKFDTSMNNIKSLNNQIKLLNIKEKNKTLNKILNKSEASKDINHHSKIKSHKNNKNIKIKENRNNKNT